MRLDLQNVHEDSRGAIYLVDGLLEGKEFTFLEIKKGYARGGCYHTVDENWVVIKGCVEVITMNIDEKHDSDGQPVLHGRSATAGESGLFKARTAHAFIAHDDSIIAEFGVSTLEKLENKKYDFLFEKVKFVNDRNNNQI